MIDAPKDIVSCALNRHPLILRARTQHAQAQGLEAVARQLPNPELDTRSTFGSSAGESVVNIEVNLAQPLELGGKRSARIDRAQAESESSASGVLKAQETVYLSTWLALYRYRQIQDENRVLDESLSTFGKILKYYSLRPALSPEQQVSRQVFDLARADSELRRSANRIELESLKSEIEIAIGGRIRLSENVLPPKKKYWPALSVEATTRVSGAEIKQARAESRVALADLEIAKSSSWPDLKIGPSFERQSEGGFSYNSWGFNLSIPLPVLQSNGAGRAYAASGVSRSESILALTEAQLKAEKALYESKYRHLSDALKSAISLEEIEKKHQNIESLFHRGLIPSSLVIESHRQILDYTRTQNEQELKAMEALAKIRLLEGKSFEEAL